MRQLGRVSERSRDLGWKEARENYLSALTEFKKDFPLTAALETELASGSAFLGGDEHLNVQIESDTSRLFKVTAHNQFGVQAFFDPHDVTGDGRYFLATGNDDPSFYLQRWKLLNEISLYQTRFEGITVPEREGYFPRICVSQPYLEGLSPTQTQISEALLNFGYHEVSAGAYYSSTTDVLLTDTFPRNVRIQGGLPALFDSVASRPTGVVKEWLLNKLKAL